MTVDELRAIAVGARGNYHCWMSEFGSMAVTLEEAEFLHAFVAMMRPKEILELGTGTGISGRFIAEAAASYGGFLTTVERDSVFIEKAKLMLEDLREVSIVSTTPENEYDLVYIDSAVNYRSADVVRWLGYTPGPLVVLHDARRRWPELALGDGIFVESEAGFWIGRGK